MLEFIVRDSLRGEGVAVAVAHLRMGGRACVGRWARRAYEPPMYRVP